MPSPVGHALAGIAAGWLIAPAPRAEAPARVLLLGAVALAPDLDLLVGAHSGPSHGIGVALTAGVIALIWARRQGVRAASLFGLAIAAAYASHPLLDWLGTDSSPPIGIMALWPFSRDYYESSLHVFMAISRRYWLPEFWSHNLLAVGRELVLLLPVLALVVWRGGATPGSDLANKARAG